MTTAIQTGAPLILLDLTGVDFMSMEAVAVLLPYLVGSAESGYQVMLRMSPPVQQKLTHLGLDSVLRQAHAAQNETSPAEPTRWIGPRWPRPPPTDR